MQQGECCFFLVDCTDKRLAGHISVVVEVFRGTDERRRISEQSRIDQQQQQQDDDGSAPTNRQTSSTAVNTTSWKLFLQQVAEAVSRPAYLHLFHITPFSLGTAVSSGWTPTAVISCLSAYSYHDTTTAMNNFITSHMERHNKAQIVVDERQRFQLCIRGRRLAEAILRDQRIVSLCAVRDTSVGATAAATVRNRQQQTSTKTSDKKIEEGDESLSHLYITRRIIRAPDEEEDEESHEMSSEAKNAAIVADKEEHDDDGELEEVQVLLQDHAASRLVSDVLWAHHHLPICQVYHFSASDDSVVHDDKGGADHVLNSAASRDHAANDVRSINLVLRPQCRPRPYQIAAVEAALAHGGTAVRSGVLLLPCGAGKTLVGVLLAAVVKKRTIIVCAGSISVEQWKNQLLEWADLTPLDEEDTATTHNIAARGGRGGGRGGSRGGQGRAVGGDRVACLTGKHKDPITEDTDVVITTYTMLGVAQEHYRREQQQRLERRKLQNRGEDDDDMTRRSCGAAPDRRSSAQSKRSRNPKEALFDTTWGLMILDEVHMAPAAGVRESISHVVSKAVVGLTATYVREDHRIRDTFHVVGPKLFDISWEELHQQGFLASITCVEVHCPMTPDFMVEYTQRLHTSLSSRSNSSKSSSAGVSALAAAPMLQAIAASNPNKMLCVWELVHRHLHQQEHHTAKILVFCDHIALLKEYAKLLGAPLVHGETSHAERMAIFSEFQSTRRVNVICISRVGDVSVNLPCANVVIQVSSHGGSRRQEAQRLGRILRPKQQNDSAGPVDAFFYSLISRDTMEVAYAAHRSEFLVDQGYRCRFIVFEPPPPVHENDEEEEGNTTGGGGAVVVVAAYGEASEKNVKRETNHGGEHSSPHNGRTGDAATVKRETLMNDVNHERRLVFGASETTRIAHANHSTFGGGGGAPHTSIVDVGRRKWQLRLLASMVGRWELQYLQATSRGAVSAKTNARRTNQKGNRRNNQDEGNESESSVSSSSGSSDADNGSDVEIVEPAISKKGNKAQQSTNHRSLIDIKKEYGVTAGVPARGMTVVTTTTLQQQQDASMMLARFTTSADGIVYHELR
ncbi:DNA repair helicase, putative [Bodo saltans]|uniref:DNA 3'-5' helicase n=1 Tax=Bodo saltans TaxID=75058 RepID=A0A0S4J760_BODSA|nr:DNA repair helicase, putative [Bodo saltans]|eukprot:CUG85974.1 DNA repair helicase, putative [Bodo saltans]